MQQQHVGGSSGGLGAVTVVKVEQRRRSSSSATTAAGDHDHDAEDDDDTDIDEGSNSESTSDADTTTACCSEVRRSLHLTCAVTHASSSCRVGKVFSCLCSKRKTAKAVSSRVSRHNNLWQALGMR